MPKTKAELKQELEMLMMEHDLIRAGIRKGRFLVIAIIIALCLLGSPWGPSGSGGIVNGAQYVIIIGVLVAGLLVYYSFIFRSQLKMRAKVSDKMKELEVVSGNSGGRAR